MLWKIQIKNTDNTHIKYNSEKVNNANTQQNTPTLVQSPFCNTQPGNKVDLFYNAPEPTCDFNF